MPERSKFPQVSPDAHFTPLDFEEVLWHVPAGCPLVGGQAVAWWAERYRAELTQTTTSQDIDFWGSREDLLVLAKAMGRRPVFPHAYEMTVWAGAVPLQLQGKRTIAEFLHTVPGLDTNNPEAASVEQELQIRGTSKRLQILSPVSLVLTKVHALRHFEQKERQDEFHLKLCLASIKPFFAELLKAKQVRLVLWNVRRLVDCASVRPNQKICAQHGLDIFSFVPAKMLCAHVESTELSQADRDKIRRFCSDYWPRVQAKLKP